MNYIEELRMKSDAKKVKYYQISKKSLEAFGQFWNLEFRIHRI